MSRVKLKRIAEPIKNYEIEDKVDRSFSECVTRQMTEEEIKKYGAPTNMITTRMRDVTKLTKGAKK